MKPERGSTETDDMEEADKDPRDLLQELVLEVLEARTPDPATKGRVEGPHCPQSRSGQSHICSDDRLECQKAYSLEQHLDLLWRNNIPACMDVLLYPDCVHGRREARVLELCQTGSGEQWTDNCILLERWTFKFCQKRVHTDMSGCRRVSPTMLLQAIKSYLHFSQLSSWLLSSGGCLPLVVAHRLYAPGESVGYEFEGNPDQHQFPSADLTHYGVKVSVSALPRCDMVHLQCKLIVEEGSQGAVSPYGKKMIPREGMKGSDERQRERDELKQTERGRSLKRTRHHQSEMSRKRENRRYPQGYPSDREKPTSSNSTYQNLISDSLSSTPVAYDRHTPGTDNQTHRFHEYRDPAKHSKSTMPVKSLYRHRHHNESPADTDFTYSIDSSYSGIQPEQSDFRESYPQKFRVESPSRKIFKDKLLPLNPDSHLQVNTMSAMSKCLHSPKVLMTSNTKPDQIFKKKCLDLSTSSDSDEWDSQYVSMKIKDLASPLSPSDIQSYLASLQTVAFTQSRSQASSEVCVTPKCKFYVGNECDVSVDNGYQSEEKKFPNKNTPSLSQSHLRNTDTDSHIHGLQDDLDCVMKKLQGLSPFSHSESPPTKKERKEVSVSKSNLKTSEKVDNSVHSGRNLTPSPLDSPSKTCKRKYSEESPVDNGAKCSNLDDSGLVTGEGPETNGHTTCLEQTATNGVSGSHDAPVNCESLQDSGSVTVSESEQSLCNNCDKPIHVAITEVCTECCELHVSEEKLLKFQPIKLLYTKKVETVIQSQLLKCVRDDRLSYLRKIPTTPTLEDTTTFQRHMTKSASMMFSSRTGLPTQSSPAPIKRKSLGRFEYDNTLTSARAIKNALSCSKLVLGCTTDTSNEETDNSGRVLSTSAPASTNCLLGNFEESVLNGRIEPIGAVDGFTAEIGASGSFCPKHVTLPVTAYFFKLSDDNAPSPYLGHINLESLGKRGYHIPKRGTVQVTLFNPNKTVVKMFVVMYDLTDMPANCQTFLRQRTLYMPGDPNSEEASYLRYLIHLRFASSKSGKVYLHTDIRLIFARDKFEFDPKVAQYELRSFNEGPRNPKFSPKR